IALKWADSGWNAMPEGYRTATAEITNTYFGRAQLKGFEATAARLGSYGLGYEAPEMTKMWGEGRNNPAALDLRPPVGSMSLAVERAVLHQQLGEKEEARAAFADLKKWEQLRGKGNLMGLLPGYPVLRGRAQLLSIGPLFAFGDYDRVIYIYEGLQEKVAW